MFNGILFVLCTGIAWEDLPLELGYGSGMSCWRRLQAWQQSGVWERLHHTLLGRLRQYDQIDWSRASIDGASVASPRGGRGVPLALMVSGANRHDSMMLEPLVDALPAITGLQGRPRRRPDKLHADKGYDFKRCRRHLRQRGIAARIARRGVEGRERLGRHRWVVERTHAWLAGFGKLRIRFERRLDTHLALLRLACAVICIRSVERFC